MRQKAELTVSGFRRLNALASCYGNGAAACYVSPGGKPRSKFEFSFRACAQNNKKQGAAFGAREGETR